MIKFTITLCNIFFLIQKGKNAIIDKKYRWKFPIPYILGDDLGEFSDKKHIRKVILSIISNVLNCDCYFSDLNAKGCVHQAFEMYRLKSCVDFKPYEGEKTYIKFEKRDGYGSRCCTC